MAFFLVVCHDSWIAMCWKNTKLGSYSGLSYSCIEAICSPANVWRVRTGSRSLLRFTVREIEGRKSPVKLALGSTTGKSEALFLSFWCIHRWDRWSILPGGHARVPAELVDGFLNICVAWCLIFTLIPIQWERGEFREMKRELWLRWERGFVLSSHFRGGGGFCSPSKAWN